jgi:hypothetical protein
MIFPSADAIISGLVSGIVATAVMTMTEIPSWRKWWEYLNGMKINYFLLDFSIFLRKKLVSNIFSFCIS